MSLPIFHKACAESMQLSAKGTPTSLWNIHSQKPTKLRSKIISFSKSTPFEKKNKRWLTMKATEKWAYSLDNEYYNSPLYDSFDDALKDGMKDAKEEGCDKVYAGRVMEFIPRVDADNVIENLQQDAYDKAGEFSLDYLEHISLEDRLKLEQMLTETFKQWAKDTNNEPSFFTVEEVSEHVVGVNKKVGK